MGRLIASNVLWRIAVAAILVFGVVAATRSTIKASADAGGRASCVGIESSAVSPPGSSAEEAGGRAQLAHQLKAFGGPPGAIYSSLAKIHAGSHDACDASTG